MKLSSVSAALLASSWVGELGDEPSVVPDTAPAPEQLDRPVRLLLLLTWCSGVGDMAESNPPKGGAGSSWAGDSRADGGAVPDWLYFGVSGSLDCGWLIYSRCPRSGTVWLRGRWKLAFPGWFRSPNMPEFGSGEKLNCEVGLKAPAEYVELGGSVTALERDVVLCECGCRYPLVSKSMKLAESESFPSDFSFADKACGEGAWVIGEAGEIPPGVCVDNNGEPVSSRALSGIAVSDALRINFPGPMLCFCLNFSIQEAVMVLRGLSEPVQNTLAFSSI